MAPVVICFDDERSPQPSAEVTEPDPEPVLTPRFALPAEPRPRPPLPAEPRPRFALPFDLEPALSFEAEPARAPVLIPVPPRAASRASTRSRLLAWSVDAALIGATAAACVAAGLRVSHVRYPFDFLRDTAALWCLLLAFTSVAYSSLLIALCGRTPGMALAGHHLRTPRDQAPTASEALLRAVLALLSAALGLFGFVLAVFDRRGQTLHDKLCGCVTIVD